MNVSTTSTIETTVETPTSEPSLGHLSTSTLSMRAKAERKRKASALHNSNFRAGFVPVSEDALQRTGIRGRKRYFLYCTLVVMMIVALLNTIVTAWLIYILGLTHMGLSSIEISTYGVRPVLRILHQAHIITLTMNGAPLGARYNSNIAFLTEESPLHVQTVPFDSNRGSSVSLDGPNITVTTECMRIQSPNTNKWLSADVESIASNFGISNYFVEDLVLNKIQSRKDMKDLYLESATREVGVNASEGMEVKSDHDVEFHAKAIKLKSMGNCTLSAKHGIYLDTNLPKVLTRKPKTSTPTVHKVCVCGNGKLFLIPSTGPRTSCRIGKKVARTVCGQ